MVYIDKKSLKPGDHIYSYRLLHTYSHHGIYVGENRVIHFTQTKGWEPIIKTDDREGCKICGYNRDKHRGVVKTCLDCFLEGHRLARYEYEVSAAQFVVARSGTCTVRKTSEPEVVVRRATEMLDDGVRRLKFGRYCLFTNNCESFALYCTTGERLCAQAGATRESMTNFKDIVIGNKPFHPLNLAEFSVEVIFDNYKFNELKKHAKHT